MYQSTATRDASLLKLVEIDRCILDQIDKVDRSECFPNSAARDDLRSVIHQIEPVITGGHVSQPGSSDAIDQLLIVNTMLLSRMEMEATEDVFPGSDHRHDLRDVLYSTLYIIRHSSGEYITEMLGPSGLTEDDVKYIATRSITRVIVGKDAFELPDAYRSRIWRGSVSNQPSHRSSKH